MNQLQPPNPYVAPAAPARESSGSAVVVWAFLLGVAGALGGFAVWLSSADAVDVTRRYVLAIMLVIVGAALMIVAAIYDR
jgi:membrane protein DedA with SNARE-associated domain